MEAELQRSLLEEEERQMKLDETLKLRELELKERETKLGVREVRLDSPGVGAHMILRRAGNANLLGLTNILLAVGKNNSWFTKLGTSYFVLTNCRHFPDLSGICLKLA